MDRLFKWYALGSGKYSYIPIGVDDGKVEGYAIYLRDDEYKVFTYTTLLKDLKAKIEVDKPEAFRKIIRLVFE